MGQDNPPSAGALAAPATGGPLETLAGRLVEALAASWQQGECRPAEEFLGRHPELASSPPDALRVVYEEVCIRQERGETVAAEEMLGRFPQWRDELRVLLDCHRLFEAPQPGPAFPAVGETWGGFHLLAELGRGAQGRVFLATQPDLAGRPVVLKLTPCTGGEHLSLARLQHTAIVPLYFVQDDPARNLRVLCMPYFGGLTLARLLEELRDVPLPRRTGGHILKALDRAQAEGLLLPGRGPARQFLARASYVQAVCWLGAALADALEYAHERGMVHLDVKPSNVLLAADGQPMLLDFHLAQPPVHPDQTRPEWIGGTLAYMPREQQAAMTAVNSGQPLGVIVDGRADVYSLGVLLYEALGGRIPVLPGVSPPLERCNGQVSRGLSDVVARCMAYRAGDRYQDAASLAADLRRHLNDHPLRGVPNRSWAERWQKWRRRQPHGLRYILLLAVVLTGAGTWAYSTWQDVESSRAAAEKRAKRAEKALAQGREWLRSDPSRAVDAFRYGHDLVKDDPDAQDLARDLAGEFRRAWRLQKANQLHDVGEQIRYISGFEQLLPRDMRQLRKKCELVWAKRRQILDGSKAALPQDVERGIRTDLLDVAVIGCVLRVQLAAEADVPAARRQALEVLDEAEKLFGPSIILEKERQSLAEQIGDGRLAKLAERRAERLSPRTSWEYCRLGCWSLRAKDYPRAQAAFRKALDLEPQSFWANYYQGVCSFEQKDNDDAVAAFRVCIALKPESPVCFYNRALAHAALKQTAAALRDLEHARQRGFDAATIAYRRALVYEQAGDRTAARDCLRQALRADPDHSGAQALSRRLRR